MACGEIYSRLLGRDTHDLVVEVKTTTNAPSPMPNPMIDVMHLHESASTSELTPELLFQMQPRHVNLFSLSLAGQGRLVVDLHAK